MSDTVLELANLIERYRSELAAWCATRTRDGDLHADIAEAWQLDEASLTILRFPCRSTGEAELKVSAILEIEGLYTIVKEDFDQDGDMLRAFLSSLFEK